MGVIYELHPAWYTHPLRLTDWTFTQTPFSQAVFAPAIMADWPLAELRVASLVRMNQVSCWRAACAGSQCRMWQREHATDVMGLLDAEFASSLHKLAHGPEEGRTAHKANFVVTVAWYRQWVPIVQDLETPPGS